MLLYTIESGWFDRDSILAITRTLATSTRMDDLKR